MVTKLQNALRFSQINRTRCHSFRVKERVARFADFLERVVVVTELQNSSPWLQICRTG